MSFKVLHSVYSKWQTNTRVLRHSFSA